MYEFIRGIVAHIDENYAAIDCSGVGYKIYASARCLASLKKNETVQLFTHLIVREDEMSLYGFLTALDRQIFVKLLSVSGVGPKAAISVLSVLDAKDVIRAAIAEDTKVFSKVPGIGPKTASRIVIEIKDKVDAADALEGTASEIISAPKYAPEGEAVEALISLGYDRADAAEAVAAVKDLADTSEDLTLLALKRINL